MSDPSEKPEERVSLSGSYLNIEIITAKNFGKKKNKISCREGKDNALYNMNIIQRINTTIYHTSKIFD